MMLSKLLLPGILLLACASAGIAQQALKFEVATIRPTKSEGQRGGLEVLPGGGLRMEGATLNGLIALAYGVREDKITGGAKWMNSETYVINAKPENPDPADAHANRIAPGSPGWGRLQERLQALLAERFHLEIRKDSKESSGYALVLAKGGTKLKASLDSQPPGTMRAPGQITGRSGSMQMLATVLSNMLGRPVMDRTGLTESYDYKLEYGQDVTPETPNAVPGPSVFSALQDQLGLRLEQALVAVDTLVVERAEKPTAN